MSSQQAEQYGVLSTFVILLCVSTLLPIQDDIPKVTIHIHYKEPVELCAVGPSTDYKLSTYGGDDVDLWTLILLLISSHNCLIKPKWVKSYQDQGQKTLHHFTTNTKTKIIAHDVRFNRNES